MTLAFASGNRAMLINPTTCAAQTFNATFTPNSGGRPTATPTAATRLRAARSTFTPTFTAASSTHAPAGHPNLTLTSRARTRTCSCATSTCTCRPVSSQRPRRPAVHAGKRRDRRLHRRQPGRNRQHLHRQRRRDLRAERIDLQRRPERHRAGPPAGGHPGQRRTVRARQPQHPGPDRAARRLRDRHHHAAAAALRGHRRAHPLDATRSERHRRRQQLHDQPEQVPEQHDHRRHDFADADHRDRHSSDHDDRLPGNFRHAADAQRHAVHACIAGTGRPHDRSQLRRDQLDDQPHPADDADRHGDQPGLR